jgi:integrase
MMGGKNRRREGREVDIFWMSPDGRRHRERRRVPGTSDTAAERWGQSRLRELLVRGPEQPKKEVPTLETFARRFIDGYARANRQKPSGIAGKETILRIHLVPLLGTKRLDAINNEAVQLLKSKLRNKAPKTVNNVLTVLNTLLKTAVNWTVIDQMPCAVRLLPTPQGSTGFHDFDAYERLVAAAKGLDARTYLITLLGGEAGLRCGEMMALEWSDVDLTKELLCVERSDWKGHVTSTKGGRLRYVPMTYRLAAALKAHRHLRGARVLCEGDGRPLSQKVMQCLVRRAAKRAGLKNEGIHVLRHSFCSHLAMKGAPARAIQELAGHKDLSTTQRYMHLSPAATFNAIRLLDGRDDPLQRGDIVETGTASK